MANLATVLGFLESYLHTCLTSMTIDSKPSDRFVKRSGKDIVDSPIESLPGPARAYQFECENPKVIQTIYSGNSYTGRVYEFVLKILYPSFEGWTQAALSDHSTILDYLLTNPSSSTGIQSVTVEDNPEIVNSPNDNTFVMVLKVKAFLEIGEND